MILFLYYWTHPHQIWWESGKVNLKRNPCVKNAHLSNLMGMLRIWQKMQLSYLDCAFTKIKDGGCLQWFAISLLLVQSSPNLIRMLRIWQRTQLLHCNCIFTKIQDGESRHLELRKSVSISLLFDQSSRNSVGMLRIWHRTQLLHWNFIFTEIQDGGRRHLEFV